MTKHPDDVVDKVIVCSQRQKDAMKKLGVFGESYSDIIQKLLDFWNAKHKGGD
jgi:hypothetical protein